MNYSVLEYDKELYQQRFSELLLADFTHKLLVQGSIDRQKASGFVDYLNSHQTSGLSSVFFDQARLENELKGGSCSVIALQIAQVALELLEKGSQELIQRVTELVWRP